MPLSFDIFHSVCGFDATSVLCTSPLFMDSSFHLQTCLVSRAGPVGQWRRYHRMTSGSQWELVSGDDFDQVLEGSSCASAVTTWKAHNATAKAPFFVDNDFPAAPQSIVGASRAAAQAAQLQKKKAAGGGGRGGRGEGQGGGAWG